jgi:hypothetical protein
MSKFVESQKILLTGFGVIIALIAAVALGVGGIYSGVMYLTGDPNISMIVAISFMVYGFFSLLIYGDIDETTR